MLTAYKFARRQALHTEANLLGEMAGKGLLVSGDAASAFAMFDEVQHSAAASGMVGSIQRGLGGRRSRWDMSRRPTPGALRTTSRPPTS
jgi:hypothetical protein